jgi:hypothetical protein
VRVLGLLSIAVLPLLAAPGEHPFDYTFRRDVKTHRIEVLLRIKSFDPKQHHLEKKNDIAYIDGIMAIGTDNTFNVLTEFTQFEVRWDGQAVEIPKSYYSDLFNPSLLPKTNPVFDPHGSVWVSVSENSEAVLIQFEGSEAAGAYKAWLVIRRDGKHERFVENTTP